MFVSYFIFFELTNNIFENLQQESVFYFAYGVCVCGCLCARVTEKEHNFFFTIILTQLWKMCCTKRPILMTLDSTYYLKMFYWLFNDVSLLGRIRPRSMLEFALTFLSGRYATIAIQFPTIRILYGFRSFPNEK